MNPLREMEMMVEQKTTHHRNRNDYQLDHLEEEPSIETDKLSYEIFSILESKFLFGYGNDDAGQNGVLPLIEQVGSVPTKTSSQRGKVCVLAIDGSGAGMRGVLVGKALSYLEQSLKSISGDSDARISDYFDLAAGTGFGGIFTAMLFSSSDSDRRPLYHADDTWRFLANNADRFYLKKMRKENSRSHRQKQKKSSLFPCVFGGIRRGERGGGTITAATAGMENSLKETFGEEITLRNTVKPVLIPCYDLRSSAPFVFSRADALEADSYDFRLWEVCRATSAELGRFEPVELRSVDGTTSCVAVDGGLVMSNPAAAAITHVLHNKQEFPFVRGVEDLLVLSLGAGVGGGGTTVFTGAKLEYDKVRRWKEEEWFRPISRIGSDGAADLIDHAVSMAFSHCRSSNNYARIQANLSGLTADVDSDPSPGNVKRLIDLADEMLKQKNVESILFGGMKKIGENTNSEKLDFFARELVLEHRSRSCRIAPTVAFKQTQPLSRPS